MQTQVVLFLFLTSVASYGFQGAQRPPRTLQRRRFSKSTIHASMEAQIVDQVNVVPGISCFDAVASNAVYCLLESDMRRDAVGKGAGAHASSATNWINDASAFVLQQTIHKLELKLPHARTGLDRDEAAAWIRWFQASPAPSILDLSTQFRSAMNASVPERSLELLDQSRQEFLSRISCRIILLPSGASLSDPLTEPTASLVYGKLLYGGATRYRLLASSNSRSSPRRAGVRTEVQTLQRTTTPVWIMYGGPDRMYEAVDMGPCAILEVVLLPRGKELTPLQPTTMQVLNFPWDPSNMFDFVVDDDEAKPEALGDVVNGCTPSSLSGGDRNAAFRSEFTSKVGGLQTQIDRIVRRVLDGRVIRPASSQDNGLIVDDTSRQLSRATLDAEELALLGLTPVKGLLLFGPPGCGKTVLAREISRALQARTPKIVAAPELLDRWVGASEKAVRALFADAEAELSVCGGDATKSALHVIVIDEIDAVFRKRSSAEDSGEATRSSVVNQILAKLDGVQSIPNVLLIGMTNRKELLDEALLRPGRLEVQIEIPLPDRDGRREILKIHFEALRKKGRLSQPLCCAIDGVSYKYKSPVVNGAVDDGTVVRLPSGRGRKRAAIRRALSNVVNDLPLLVQPYYDLAADFATGGFSGADIAGLVRCAGSLALSRARKDGSGVEGLLITLEDVKQALLEVKR